MCLLAALPLVGQILAPRLSIDADGATAMTLYRGRPLFVNGLMSHSQRAEATPPIVLITGGAVWTDALKLVVKGQDGQEVVWPLVPLGTADSGTLKIPPKGRVPMSWLLASSETANLNLGAYTLTLVLTIADSTGWNGTVRSAPVTVLVDNEPKEISSDEQRRLGLLRAREARETKSGQEKAILANLFVRWPKDVEVLTAMALGMELEGAPSIWPYLFVQAAIESFLSSESILHAPPGLMELRNRLSVREPAAAPQLSKPPAPR